MPMLNLFKQNNIFVNIYTIMVWGQTIHDGLVRVLMTENRSSTHNNVLSLLFNVLITT